MLKGGHGAAVGKAETASVQQEEYGSVAPVYGAGARQRMRAARRCSTLSFGVALAGLGVAALVLRHEGGKPGKAAGADADRGGHGGRGGDSVKFAARVPKLAQRAVSSKLVAAPPWNVARGMRKHECLQCTYIQTD